MKEKNQKILIIGAGVIGLTTALCLREQGFSVSVVADKFTPCITSNVAGALWEWPPAVCGYHLDQLSLDRSKDWCMVAYRKFKELANNHETGVYIRVSNFYFNTKIEENKNAYKKMHELKNKVDGFYRSSGLLNRHGINQHLGLQDAYRHLAPMIDTDKYMNWLTHQARRRGCELVHGKIDNLLKNESRLKKHFKADIIVNSAGLNAGGLVGEEMYTLRGALIRVINDGICIPKITESFCISHEDSSQEQDIVFIVPRGEDKLVLGGLAEKNQWNKHINFQNYQPIREMYDRCIEFMPHLKYAKIDPIEPVRVGLRPFRVGNVCLKWVEGTSIINNYGHGGAGFSFSWGCAEEIVTLVKQRLSSIEFAA